MDQSVSLQFDKMVENKDDMDNCRILHGLNINCQLEVLQYLSVADLLQVSKLGSYFEEIIKKYIIGNKLLNLEVTDPCEKSEVLEAFGKSIRKIRASGNNYTFILETIINCCSPNLMTDIQIIVNYPSPFNGNVVRSLPSFTNLQKLRIDSKYGSQNIVDQLKEIAVSALNLKILQLRGYNIQGEWLRTKHMNNLSELWMHTSTDVSIDDLTYFIREHPKLQVFSFTGLNDIVAIGNCLAENCKNLKKFCYEDLKERDREDDEDNVGDKLEVSKNGTKNHTSNRYSFLSSFPQLNVFTFTSFSYLNTPLMSLTSRYNVKELKININLSSFTNQCKLKHLIDSQTVEIDIRKYSNKMGKREPCHSTFQYIVDIAAQMKNLEKITISSGKKISNLHKILELAPNIRILSISNVDFLHLPVEIRKIARTLRKMRQERKYNDLLHLIVNEGQFRELEIYEKENILSASIDPQLSRKRYKMY